MSTLRAVNRRDWAAVLAAGLACALSATAHHVELPAPIRLGHPERTVAAPRVATAADGSVYLLWVEKGLPQPGRGHASSDDLYLARWPRGAAVPEPAVRVNPEAGTAKASALIRAQLEVSGDGGVHVLYPANARSPLNGKPVVDLRYQRSTDGGRSFSAPQTLNSPSPNDLGASSHSDIAAAATFPALTTLPGGRVLAFWLDSRHVANAEDPSDVYAALSSDGGRSWGPDRRLYGGDVCECCQPVAVRAGEGALLSSRHVDGDGHRDPIVTRISAELEVRDEPARIGTGRWSVEGCPMKATALGADGERAYVAWYSQADTPSGVWFARSQDGGRHFDAGRALHPDAEIADAPTIALGDSGHVVLTWHAKAGLERQVFIAESRDHGLTFSTPRAVTDGNEAAGYPSLGIANREVVVAWQQGNGAYVQRWSATQ